MTKSILSFKLEETGRDSVKSAKLGVCSDCSRQRDSFAVGQSGLDFICRLMQRCLLRGRTVLVWRLRKCGELHRCFTKSLERVSVSLFDVLRFPISFFFDWGTSIGNCTLATVLQSCLGLTSGWVMITLFHLSI